MAKKRKPKVQATQELKLSKPVRLDLTPADHERLERIARKRGLTMASFARMILLERMNELEPID